MTIRSGLRSALRTGLRRTATGLAATGVAASLMTAAWAVPARADSKDVAKILAGIAAIALIAKAIDDGNDRKDDRRPAITQHRADKPLRPDAPFVPGYPHEEDYSRGERTRIPGECALEVRDRLAYGEQCLVSYGLRRLPRHCAYDATIFGRADRLYPAACLREAGFRLPRR